MKYTLVELRIALLPARARWSSCFVTLSLGKVPKSWLDNTIYMGHEESSSPCMQAAAQLHSVYL